MYGDILRIEGNTVYFDANTQQHFDAIILATGYHHSLENFLDPDSDRLDDFKKAIVEQTMFGKDRLYFRGFYLSPMGMLNVKKITHYF